MSVVCEHCGAEFDDERVLADHWYEALRASDDEHSLTAEQQEAALEEYTRQWRAHEVHIEIEVEIPREAWAWAVNDAGVDTPSDAIEDLPDPNDMPDAAIDMVDAHYHYEVDPDDEHEGEQ